MSSLPTHLPVPMAAIDDAPVAFHAQSNEDRVLAEYFAGRPTGRCVEVGAYNGVDLSNTFHFEQQGWECLLVEADPELVQACRRSRPGARVVHAAAVGPSSPPKVTFEVLVGWPALSGLSVDPEMLKTVPQLGDRPEIRRIVVPARTLDDILAEWNSPGLEFVTIDVEGAEWETLKGFDLQRWRPEMLLLERNHELPDRRITERLEAQGYVYFRTTGVNDWFVRKTPEVSRSLTSRARRWMRYDLALWLKGPLNRRTKGALRRVGLLEPVLWLLERF